MENCTRTTTGYNDILASRKAEEAAYRRFEAAAWLESQVGPLGMSSHPSEKEFVSCLRNGSSLCAAINKVNPGAVPKVVENHTPLQSLNRELQPLPAYQYFENVRNFLVAVEELKLPAFEASDLERDTLEAGSAAKVVDCILALKLYHEYKQTNCGNGFHKPLRSPMVMHPATVNNCRSISLGSSGCLNMSTALEKHSSTDVDIQKLADLIVKLQVEHMVDTKENIDGNLLMSCLASNMDLEKLLTRIVSSCMEDKIQNNFLGLKSMFEDFFKESSAATHSTSASLKDSSELRNSKCCQACSRKGNCKHKLLFQMQEKELMDLKALLMNARWEFEDLQSQFWTDFRKLGYEVQGMFAAALGYHKVLKENRNLYNMVQDLKGNIRVYCRIRPTISGEKSDLVDFIGEDGSLVILDPLKPKKDGRKHFQFDRVFGPTATQDDLYKDTQPLIRSVMDGYNVCIFAYGQTGSGKTYTMSGPSGGSTKDMGINYLALKDLFQMSKKRKEIIDYDIRVQMVEIHNEQIRDLLVEDSSVSRLEIRSGIGENGSRLPDAKMHSVKSTDDLFNLMKVGEMNRIVSCTAMNNRSNRSHSVLMIHVHGKDISGSTLRSCLHLVDLAGSERIDKSEVTGYSLREAQYINKSLSCLGDVITALDVRNSHVPYRNSKLTLLLQDSLGGHAKTLMFAHISPEQDSFEETISTLKFAQRVSTVELGAARANKETNKIMQLKEHVENLRKALANKEVQNLQLNKMKEPRSPSEKPKAMTEKTPPRVRRLSIENGSNMKSQTVNSIDKKVSKTHSLPTCSRRLSLEGTSYTKKEVQNSQLNKMKEPRSPCEKPKAMTERTPRVRRLSIENGSTMKSQKVNPIDKKVSKIPSLPTRSRRLSLEGQSYTKKDNFQTKLVPNNITKPLYFEAVTLHKYGQSEDPEAVSKLYGYSAVGSSIMEVHHCNAPRSPTSSSHQKRMVKTESRTQIPLVPLSTTPEQVLARSKVLVMMENEFGPDSQTTDLISNESGKGSQIRKSLRTIGKLINGSEKRIQQHSKESQSPINGTAKNKGVKSPLTAGAKAARRQSLTGVQSTGPDRSCSSIEGRPIDYGNADDSTRNARTPLQFIHQQRQQSDGFNAN